MQDKIALQDEQIADQKDAADSEDSSSEAEKGGAIDEMQDKITVQEAEIEHAADSEDSSSDTKAEKGGVVDEMQDKIALQDAQIADQQKELMRQKIQIEQMARQFGVLTELQEGVQNMQDSQAGSSASFETVFYCDPNANESASKADAVESEDAQLDADAREGGTMRNHYRKIKLGIRRGRPSKLNSSSSGYNRL